MNPDRTFLNSALHDVLAHLGKGPMSWYVRLFDPVVFDPKLLATVQNAFDAAWAMHTSDFGIGDPLREEAREVLARAIMESAMGGEHDAERLQYHGLGELLRFRNQPMAQVS